MLKTNNLLSVLVILFLVGAESDPDPICALKNLEEMITSFKTRALLLEDERESLLSSLMTFTDDFIFQSNAEKTPLKLGKKKRS